MLPRADADWFACDWRPSEAYPELGHLWVAVKPTAVAIKSCIHNWPMHLTLFTADFVRKPSVQLVNGLRQKTRDDFFYYSFVAAETPMIELETGWRHRVLLYLWVQTSLHNALHLRRTELKNRVWDYARSRCTRSEQMRYNFRQHLKSKGDSGINDRQEVLCTPP